MAYLSSVMSGVSAGRAQLMGPESSGDSSLTGLDVSAGLGGTYLRLSRNLFIWPGSPS